MSDATPANTHAIVVGIELYEAGPSWILDGPASDAIRFMEYLIGRGVPKSNIQAFLSTLPENASLNDRAQQLAWKVGTPTQAEIDDVVEKQLPPLKADFLLFFWAGHGVITVKDDRRLYTADATSKVKRNVDLNALLATLRSGLYPHIQRQAVIVDACANYIADPVINLTQKTFPMGAGMVGIEQFALYAASPGEYAKNLNAEKTGLLSRELLEILQSESADVWPPNLAVAAEKLATQFIALRQHGKTRQTPSTFWFRSPTKSGQYLGDRQSPGERSAPPVTYESYDLRQLTLTEEETLLEALLQLDTMRNRKDRDWVVRQLRPEIGTRIDRRDNDRMDTWMILSKSRSFNALQELLRSIRSVEGKTALMQTLISLAHEMLPNEAPAALD